VPALADPASPTPCLEEAGLTGAMVSAWAEALVEVWAWAAAGVAGVAGGDLLPTGTPSGKNVN